MEVGGASVRALSGHALADDGTVDDGTRAIAAPRAAAVCRGTLVSLTIQIRVNTDIEDEAAPGVASEPLHDPARSFAAAPTSAAEPPRPRAAASRRGSPATLHVWDH